MIVEEEYRTQFVLTDLTTKIFRKSLRLGAEYNIVTNQDILFHIEVWNFIPSIIIGFVTFQQACLPEDPMFCTRVSVNVSYPFNYHRPSFNQVSGEARISNYEACDEDWPQTDINCQVVFLEDFFAVDADGDTVTYSIVPPSDLFRISDERDLSSLYYRGVGLSQDVTIPLLIQVAVLSMFLKVV